MCNFDFRCATNCVQFSSLKKKEPVETERRAQALCEGVAGFGQRRFHTKHGLLCLSRLFVSYIVMFEPLWMTVSLDEIDFG